MQCIAFDSHKQHTWALADNKNGDAPPPCSDHSGSGSSPVFQHCSSPRFTGQKDVYGIGRHIPYFVYDLSVRELDAGGQNTKLAEFQCVAGILSWCAKAWVSFVKQAIPDYP